MYAERLPLYRQLAAGWAGHPRGRAM